MKSQTKKEKNRTVTHKRTPDIQKIEWEKRRKRWEEIKEKVVLLQQEIMMNGVTKPDGNPQNSGHERQEEGVDEYVSPMEEDLWVERGRALQVTILHNIMPHSLSNIIQSSQLQDIV